MASFERRGIIFASSVGFGLWNSLVSGIVWFVGQFGLWGTLVCGVWSWALQDALPYWSHK